MHLKIHPLPHYQGLELPAYQSAAAAGLDLRAAISADITLNPAARMAIPSGLMLAIPKGYEGQIRPRSGLAHKHGITLANAPGTIDADYRGEVMILLIHLGGVGDAPFTIQRGDRIAQLVIAPISQMQVEITHEFDDTTRGAGGFGSTGMT